MRGIFLNLVCGYGIVPLIMKFNAKGDDRNVKYCIRSFCVIKDTYEKGISHGDNIRSIMLEITDQIPTRSFPVSERVLISSFILQMLNREERLELSRQLLEEQVNAQRVKLNHWSTITAQSSQIDTGYIAQHLVSLQTQIAGQGMRGKGDDLSDGSEVKSANFLDSLDKKGATAPRWNFTAVTRSIMEEFLNYSSLYLLSMDLNTHGRFRVRIWKINVLEHDILRSRYIEWMNTLGYSKFDSDKEEGVNFQLFPPRSQTDDNFARHGNGRKNGFSKLEIPLEDYNGTRLIFKAEDINDEIVISKF